MLGVLLLFFQRNSYLLPEEVANVAVEALQWETKYAFVPKSLSFYQYFSG